MKTLETLKPGFVPARNVFWNEGLKLNCVDPSFCCLTNEFLCQGEITLVVVTDGMGGHEGGEFASFFATEALSSIWCQSAKPSEAKLRESEQVLVESIQNCNDKIYSINEKLNVSRAMGTTITAGLFIPGKLIVAHVGDSRAYMLRNGKLTQLTEDQTWVAKMVKMGNLRPEEAENHPLSHLLSNCMGAGSSLDVQVSICRRKQNDRFMFCSDGLYGSLTELLIIPAQMEDAPTWQNSQVFATVDAVVTVSRGGHGDVL